MKRVLKVCCERVLQSDAEWEAYLKALDANGTPREVIDHLRTNNYCEWHCEDENNLIITTYEIALTQ